MSRKPEQSGVEHPAIATLVTLGYTHLPGATLQHPHRHLAPVLEDVLRARLLQLNPWLASAPGGTDAPLIELRKLANQDLAAANQAIWEKAIHRADIQTKDQDGMPRSVRFLDPQHAANNDFHVVSQYTGKNTNGDFFRPDLLLFINGLPLAIIECKASNENMGKALTQLDGYQAAFPAHFTFNQICAGINRNDARYGAIGAKPEHYARHRLNSAEQASVATLLGQDPSEQDKLLWALFEPSRFLQLVAHFVLFEKRDSKTTKKLPRHQQWRAVRSTLARLSAAKPTGGVVWHTQGSGKSLTMALLARILRAESSGLGNPSILVLTDRRNLDDQIAHTFSAVGLKPIQAASVDGLAKLLSNDYGAIFTSTIQKFQESDPAQSHGSPQAADSANQDADAPSRQRRIRVGKDFFIVQENNLNCGLRAANGNPLPAEWLETGREKVHFRVLSNKANFYVLVDEAHRSQYDFLAAFMRASLPKAKFIAFTGTPLLAEDKHTLAEFGGGADSYIDEYRLHEAVADEATLPIKYLESWVELAVGPELEKAFRERFATESDIRQQTLKRALLARWRQAADRLQKIAEHLAGHFLTSVRAKGLKAMLVCDGRERAIAYKDLLDGIMQQRAAQGQATFESRVVVSLGSITANRTGLSVQEGAAPFNLAPGTLRSIEERVHDEIRDGKPPVALHPDHIANFVGTQFPLPYPPAGGGPDMTLDGKPLSNNVGLVIVSDMLLTGWDAPVVGTLYLDKPLREHTLLQAIARVNRTLGQKNAGYIVDYHGVLDNLDEALKTYGGELQPPQVWQGVETELPKLQATLERLRRLLPDKHHPETQREEYKADAERFLDPDTRLDAVEDFLELSKQFNRALDIILPDQRALPYKPWFTLLAEIRLTLRDKLPGGPERERVTKLESVLLQQLLDEHIAASPARSLLGREVSILDAADMGRLKKLASPESQALVMKNQLKHTIATGRDKDPAFFDKLAEELEKLLAAEREGRLSQAQFLQQLELFTQRVADKDKTGFTHPAHSAVFHYLADLLPEASARSATAALFQDPGLAGVTATEHWKAMEDLHPKIKERLHALLTPMAGWERSAARRHAARILDIMLKN